MVFIADHKHIDTHGGNHGLSLLPGKPHQLDSRLFQEPNPDKPVHVVAKELNVRFDRKKALKNVSMKIRKNQVTALTGPSGCGKSTFIRCLNRTLELVPEARITGLVSIDGEDIYNSKKEITELRRHVGIVAQKPNPFPKSIYENIAYGPRIHGMIVNKADMNNHVEECLTRAGLWNEVKDRLKEQATDLSGGQQQRLCIARAVSVKPDILLMDEPCSAIDPIATATVEDLITSLAATTTVIIITHSMEQAARIAHDTAYFHMGKLIEYGPTRKMFLDPQEKKTREFLSGNIG